MRCYACCYMECAVGVVGAGTALGMPKTWAEPPAKMPATTMRNGLDESAAGASGLFSSAPNPEMLMVAAHNCTSFDESKNSDA